MNNFIRQNKINVEVLNRRREEIHNHSDAEFLYILDGTMSLTLVERKYVLRRGDILVINASTEHSFENSEDILFVKIMISSNLIRQVYNSISSTFLCNSCVEQSEKYESLRKILNQLLRYKMISDQNEELEKQNSYEYISQFFHLLGYLTNNFLIKTPVDKNTSKHLKEQKRIQQINSYIEENYSQPISLKSLSEAMYLSEGYLSRYFKKTYQMSFTAYLRQVRLSKAMEQLIYTDMPILQIALDCGFSSISFFNKTFKDEYGHSPSTIRRKSVEKREHIEEKTDYLIINERLEQFIYSQEQGEEKKKGKEIKKSYSVLKSTEITPFWNEVLNIGQASDILKHEIQEHIVKMKETMGFRYVRCWSILSPEMLIYPAIEQEEYNFTRLDQVIDFILGIGMKPFIDLEEKARRINKNNREQYLYEERKAGFSDIGQWERFFQKLMYHWVRRYGVKEMSSWKLEVWFGDYTVNEYGDNLNIFERFYAVFKSIYFSVKKMVPDMEVGGCGVFQEYLQDCMQLEDNIWEHWIEYAPVPDFISVMNFAYEPDRKLQFGSKSEDQEYLLHSIERLKKEQDSFGLGRVKIYVTEWNLTVSDRNRLNDTCFQGAYIVKNVIDVYGQLNLLAYFMGTDRYSEYYDSKDILFGGPGLLTKDGITKPSGYAFRFLNKLYPYFVDKSDNMIITTNRRQGYSIVCHNMQPLGYYYYLTDESDQDHKKIWKYFDNLNSLSMDITLRDIENGEYRVKIQKVNDKSGSIHEIWEDMEYCGDLSINDLAYLKRACVPRMILRTFKIEDRKISIQLNMMPNEIALIHVEKIK